MVGRGRMRGRKRGQESGDDNGFAEWGGYMEAKKTKLQDQFKIDAANEISSENSQIFNGVAIFVNGYSVPSADELKLLMMKHGGIYHHYYRTDKTTHIIATNLPDTKVKQLRHMNVVKPDWIVASIAAGKLLDYRQFLLYSRQSKTQPKLAFKQVSVGENESTSSHVDSTVKTSQENDQEQADIRNVSAEENLESNSPSPLSLEHFDQTEEPQSVNQNQNMLASSAYCKTASHSIKTASEVGFLSEFYSNSRLHLISTMGAMFKQYVSNLREKSTCKFPGLEKLMQLKQDECTFLNSGINGAVKYKKVIMHIDMDCFFVSVGIRNRPELKGLPVAVTHAKARAERSNVHRTGVNRKAEFELYKTRREEKVKAKNQLSESSDDVKPWSDWVEAIDESNSMSEIASCNYEARQKGLKNGMFLGQALKLCPNLKTIPYDFEGYKEVSNCLYNTVASYTLDIEAVSCDEMYVDCTSLLNSTCSTPLKFASLLRAEIKDKTGCPCSTGFGCNRLQARLATRRAKPDGQFFLEPSAVQTFVLDIGVSELPGVGRSTNYKLASMGIKTCLDLQQIPLSKLQADFGVKIGDSLYKSCRGEDSRNLVFDQVRKSVSAEVNYGIRFKNITESNAFIEELAREVHNRLQDTNMKTKVITLKLMVRAKDAPAESAKFLGHGVCDCVSRSVSLQTAVADVDSIIREVMSLNRQLSVEPTELRGVGIQLSRLESCVTKPSGNIIDKFLRPKSEIARECEKGKQINTNTETGQVSALKIEKKSSSCSAIDHFFVEKKLKPNQSKQMPGGSKSVKDVKIDNAVLEALPEEIRREVMAEYGLAGYEGNKETDRGPSNQEEPRYDCALNYSQIDLEVLQQLPLEIKREIEQSIKPSKVVQQVYEEADSENDDEDNIDKPKLDRSLSLKEIRELISAWTVSEDCPQACDMDMLAEYLQALVHSRHLDSLDTCVSCLHRCIEKNNSPEWRDTYHTIMQKVQSTMLAVYGLALKVPKTFHTLT